MTWPARMPDGTLIHPMRGASRSYHVRKHLLCRRERWDEVTSLERGELSRWVTELEAEGCRCGALAAMGDAPDASGHGLAHDLYARDYMPVARIALEDAFELRIRLLHVQPTSRWPRRAIYVLTKDHVVVVCDGRDHLRWRTAYRLVGRHRRGATLERIHRRHVRAAAVGASIGRRENRGGGR